MSWAARTSDVGRLQCFHDGRGSIHTRCTRSDLLQHLGCRCRLSACLSAAAARRRPTSEVTVWSIWQSTLPDCMTYTASGGSPGWNSTCNAARSVTCVAECWTQRDDMSDLPVTACCRLRCRQQDVGEDCRLATHSTCCYWFTVTAITLQSVSYYL